ncbi:MAG TPA: glycogen/starch/alpha-glucan phosphorylase [Candidatus Avoscillospira avicola]|uniref:Alpha-1,4 glucan phosphorylase n=1 Tax=Candidatus Avoscillospira avicola TaxID=2840706 RepID=A0A9D1DH04_9FIRM|nr:glycogen/starch/alpha-glucan phosphorylase [Candidatus Avoscillospira avicola]
MSYSIPYILNNTEALLKLKHDETLTSTTPQRLHDCLGQAVMMAINKNWTQSKKAREGHRKAYYFSAEYLMGRLVYSNLFNMGILEPIRKAFAEKGVDLAELEDIEDAALGNGGLGRLAACFLDSAVTKGIPLSGYGLRYRFGLFKQSFDENGNQKEAADDWTRYGDPWSYRREKHAVKVSFADQTVIAVPYDMPILGYGTDNIGTLRLWQCEPEQELDFDAFNAQDYEKALLEKNKAEDITRVLYPNDSTREGKELRIKQQYVLSSASLQDILRVYRTTHGKDFVHLHEAAAIQLNDTHPALSIPELIRLLMAEGLDFESATQVAGKTFAYTNHTVMGEALEKWDLDLLAGVVPEIVEILKKLDARCRSEHPQLSLIRDNQIHMADLSVYLSTAVNGVAEIHTEILKRDVFQDWYAVYPEKFQNKTNGITPRRWLGLCNPELTKLLEQYVSPGFLTQLDWLQVLKPVIDDQIVREFNQVKDAKKRQLVQVLLQKEGVVVDPSFVFDVQIKRLHEYKRQLLNGFSILDIYYGLKDGTITDFTPTLFLFGAKSAPGYQRAKAIIRYLNQIAKLINNDPEVAGKMQVVFVQNYNCSYAEHIIPAADISEQISPAGTEASGTGNMKLMLNGAVTLGTLDGANVEIVRQAGAENNYIFGATVEELEAIRDTYNPMELYEANPRLRRVVDSLIDGTVPTDDEFQELHDSLLKGASWHKADHYYLLKDFDSYQEARLRANRDYRDRLAFGKKCLMNVASAGKFSSDRTIRQYAQEIWHV